MCVCVRPAQRLAYRLCPHRIKRRFWAHLKAFYHYAMFFRRLRLKEQCVTTHYPTITHSPNGS
jgi:hypothetical protein